jgi:hypothetical protein
MEIQVPCYAPTSCDQDSASPTELFKSTKGTLKLGLGNGSSSSAFTIVRSRNRELLEFGEETPPADLGRRRLLVGRETADEVLRSIRGPDVMEGLNVARSKRRIPGELGETQDLPCQSFFVLEGKNGFFVEDGAGADPFDHELVAPAPVEQGPYGPVCGKDRVPLSPTAPKGCESDPIGEEKVNAARISIRSSARRDERFVTSG